MHTDMLKVSQGATVLLKVKSELGARVSGAQLKSTRVNGVPGYELVESYLSKNGLNEEGMAGGKGFGEGAQTR